MNDFTKYLTIDGAIKTFSDVSIKTINFNQNVFKESVKFFDDLTDKAFYTYTVQAADAVNKVTEYAKETIKTQKIPSFTGTTK